MHTVAFWEYERETGKRGASCVCMTEVGNVRKGEIQAVEVSQRWRGEGLAGALEAGCEGFLCRGKNTGESRVLVVTVSRSDSGAFVVAASSPETPILMLYK